MKQTQSSYTFGSLLLALVGVTVLYQLTFHAIIWRAVQQEDKHDLCGTFGDSTSVSPQCLELRLFRSWQKASVEPHESDEDLLHLMDSDVDVSTSAKSILRGSPDIDATKPSAQGASAELTPTTWDTVGLTHEVKAPTAQPEISSTLSPLETGLPELSDMSAMADHLMGLQNELHERLELLIRKNGNVVASDSLASDIADVRKRIESRKTSIQDVRKLVNHDIPKQVERSGVDFGDNLQVNMPLEDLQNATQSSENDITPWAADLMHLQERLESRQKALLEAHSQRLRHQHASPDRSDVRISEQPSTAWATDLMHLQERLEAREKALLETHAKRLRHQQTSTLVGASQDAEAPVLENVSQLHLDVKRHHQIHAETSSAAAAHIQALGNKVANQKEEHKNWQSAISTSIIEYKRKLCTELHRREDPLCKRFFIEQNISNDVVKDSGIIAGQVTSKTTHTRVAAAAVGSFSLRLNGFLAAAPLLLHWSAAKAWSSIPKDATPISVKREQLTGLKWGDKIPKVACITVVPAHGALRARMKYFINNFLLQQYEGPRQLVLVYHKDDAHAESLVKTYTDGVFIKGVATMGSGEFPSSTDLRYGAWKAEADIIAHWDFEEWHHPDRLTLQIRALALAGRPASLLKQWTVMENGEANTVFAGIGWEGSLVGEKKWMHENWHPILGGSERSVLEDTLSHQLVQVAVPELSIFNVGPDGWDSVLRHFGREATADISEEELADMERSSDELGKSSSSGDQQGSGGIVAAVEPSPVER